MQCTLIILHIMQSWQCNVHSQCNVHNAMYTMYTMQCTQCTKCNVHSSVYNAILTMPPQAPFSPCLPPPILPYCETETTFDITMKWGWPTSPKISGSFWTSRISPPPPPSECSFYIYELNPLFSFLHHKLCNVVIHNIAHSHFHMQVNQKPTFIRQPEMKIKFLFVNSDLTWKLFAL